MRENWSDDFVLLSTKPWSSTLLPLKELNESKLPWVRFVRLTMFFILITTSWLALAFLTLRNVKSLVRRERSVNDILIDQFDEKCFSSPRVAR